MFYGETAVPNSYIEEFAAHVRSVTGDNSWSWAADHKGRVTLTRYPIVWSAQVSHRIHATWIDLPASVSSKDLLIVNVHFMTVEQSETARDFIRNVRSGTHSAGIPSDISIVSGGDFNALYNSARYNNIANEGFADMAPAHNGTSEKNTIGGVGMDNGSYVSPIGRNHIDFVLLRSDVLSKANSFILNTIIMPQADRNAFGFQQRDIAVDAHKTDLDFMNGNTECDHFPLVVDLREGPLPGPNDSAFVSQSVPASMLPGETKQVTVRMRNTGADTWSSSAGHKLGTQNPRDNKAWTGATRVALAQNVAPNADHDFTFDITAPSTPGVYDFQWQMVDDSGANVGWFGQITPNVTIMVTSAPPAGSVLLAVDLHLNSTDPLPAVPEYFTAWTLGQTVAGDAAPSTVINGLAVTIGTGDSVGCLANPALQTGFNARNRAGHILNSGAFTQANMMRERIASLVLPTDPATGNGTGNGIYLKISGLAPNARYLIRSWGVDSTGTNPNATLKNGYNYGFDATTEAAGYSGLPQLGSFTVSGNPTTIIDNNAYSISGMITSDANGTIIYKQISDIDKSVMNGFVLSSASVDDDLTGYELWVRENDIEGLPEDMYGNGLSNLGKYAIHEQPTLVKSGSSCIYSHKVRKGDDSITYVVETTTDLANGEWDPVEVEAVTNAATGLADYNELTREIPATGLRFFIRLKITWNQLVP
jgi:hypothetical protein